MYQRGFGLWQRARFDIANEVGNTPPPAAGAFAWGTDLPAPAVELLKSKGMYDDPVKGANMLATSYYEANKLISDKNAVSIPAADAKPEVWDAFLNKLRPETADKYELKATEASVDDKVLGFAKKLAHFWGVPAHRAQGGLDMWQEFAKNQNADFVTNSKTANDAAVATMKNTMGEAKWTEAVGNSQKIFKALASQKDTAGKPLISVETMNAIERNMGSAALLEMMSAIGSKMGAEGLILNGAGGGSPSDPSQMTAEQAQTEINRLQADKDFQAAYWDARHAEHQTSVQRMNALYAARHKQAA